MYRTDKDWKELTKNTKIRADETKYMGTNDLLLKRRVAVRVYKNNFIAFSSGAIPPFLILCTYLDKTINTRARFCRIDNFNESVRVFIHRVVFLFERRCAVKNMVGGKTYYFRVLAHGNSSYESSEELKYFVPARVKQKAVTAGVVGGILFFIVAIILSICAVKICNKRKRRKQEKGWYL